MNNLKKNKLIDKGFKIVGLLLTSFALIVLAIFIVNIAIEGIPRIDWQFITSPTSSLSAKRAGIYPALIGTLWVFLLTAAISIPLGISAGIYFEEYAKKNRLSAFLELNLSNLAGIPSVIYGLLGLAIFETILQLNSASFVFAGAFTLSLLILPVIIVSTREAVKAVPKSLKEASYGLGATKWQTIWNTILPSSLGGILTGTILALSRAIGETAPLMVIGVPLFIRRTPTALFDFETMTPSLEGLGDNFTVLPMQIYYWVTDKKEFIPNASAAIVILLLITFSLNGIAIYFRNKNQKKIRW